MVAGLEKVTGGEIAINGERGNDTEPKDPDIAMVIQNYALYPQVEQNMAGRSKTDKKAKVAKAAEILSLTTLLDRKPGQFSGEQY